MLNSIHSRREEIVCSCLFLPFFLTRYLSYTMKSYPASCFVLCALLLILATRSTLSAQNLDTPRPKALFNQQYIEDINADFPIDSVEAMFDLVFFQMPDSVFLYPTENYYYFRIYTRNQWIWGNFRLSVLERDKGLLNFAYYPYVDDPKSPDESPIFLKSYSAKDGVVVHKHRELCYTVEYGGKKVIFQLNDMEQAPPRLFSLRQGEVFLQRTFDESGFPFFLLFDSIQKHFMFVLNEEIKPLQGAVKLQDNILLDKLSGFVFYEDPEIQGRKTLMGVWAQNIRRNNYWDGPFDQLADNFVHPRMGYYMETAYPYAKGGLDNYGFFRIVEASRLAINPYFEYDTIEELLKNFDYCKNQASKAEFYTCLCYDYKTSFPPNEPASDEEVDPKKDR